MTIFGQCAAYRDDLAAFVDGELTGSERLRMTEHLEQCPACAVEAERVQNIGSLLRTAAEEVAASPPMNGLAGGVVARVRAESAQSWRAVLGRGLDDWHWFIVGGGSVAATFVSMLFVTALLFFGSKPVQHDSLAGLLSSLQTHPGTLLVEVGGSKTGQVMQVGAGGSASVLVMPTAFGMTKEDLLSKFVELVVSERGDLVSLGKMGADARRDVEVLLKELEKLREGGSGRVDSGRLDVVRIRLLTSVSVPALMP
jgi:hypothetical protein